MSNIGVELSEVHAETINIRDVRVGFTWEQEYAKGIPRGELAKAGKVGKKTGTKITFKADSSIMDATKFNFDTLATRLRELAFLNSGVKISLVDQRTGKEEIFAFTGGVKGFVEYMNRSRSVLHQNIFYALGEKDGIAVELAKPIRCRRGELP